MPLEGQPLRRKGDPELSPPRRPSVKQLRHGRAWQEVCQGADLTPDEVEFGRAMVRWMRKHDRQPHAVDVLAVAKALGYRRVG